MNLRWPPVVALTAVWLLLWGEVTALLLVGGVLVSLVVLVVFPFPRVPWRWTVRPWPLAVLVGVFVADLLRASVEVAWLAIRPAAPPPSAVIRVQLQTRSELFMTATALLVSLVPGSVLVETEGEKGLLWLHVLDARSPERIARARRAVLDQEQRVLRALCRGDELVAVDVEESR